MEWGNGIDTCNISCGQSQEREVLFSNVFVFGHTLSRHSCAKICFLFFLPSFSLLSFCLQVPSFSCFELQSDFVFFLTVFLALRGVETVICLTVSYEGSPGAVGDVPKTECWTAFFTRRKYPKFRFLYLYSSHHENLPIYHCIFIFQLDFINIQMITKSLMLSTLSDGLLFIKRRWYGTKPQK